MTIIELNLKAKPTIPEVKISLVVGLFYQLRCGVIIKALGVGLAHNVYGFQIRGEVVSIPTIAEKLASSHGFYQGANNFVWYQHGGWFCGAENNQEFSLHVVKQVDYQQQQPGHDFNGLGIYEIGKLYKTMDGRAALIQDFYVQDGTKYLQGVVWSDVHGKLVKIVWNSEGKMMGVMSNNGTMVTWSLYGKNTTRALTVSKYTPGEVAGNWWCLYHNYGMKILYGAKHIYPPNMPKDAFMGHFPLYNWSLPE